MGSRVAVLEDDDQVREVVVLALEARGYDVSAFATLGEAMDALLPRPPDLVIADVQLPDGNGLDLVARLSSGEPAVPAIVLSTLQSEDDFQRGFAAGAADYLGKPFRREELLARVALHLRRSGVRRADGKDELPSVDGLVFGRYRLERRLGAGGFATVFLARDAARGDAKVALKVLARLSQASDEARLRFIRESYTLAAIRDPHIVGVTDVGAFEHRLYLAMEFVEGTTLDSYLEANGTLAEPECRVLANGLLAALDAVERAGILHRDLKPANMMLRGGRLEDPVLIDFGLAKRPFDRSVTAVDMLVGTPAYMSPEAIEGQPMDRRSDLFSAGLTLRYALHGQDVFPDLSGVELLLAIAKGPLPLPRSPMSPGFAQWLASLLEVQPQRRPASARAARAELAALPPPLVLPGTARAVKRRGGPPDARQEPTEESRGPRR